MNMNIYLVIHQAHQGREEIRDIGVVDLHDALEL